MKAFIVWFAGFFQDQAGSASSKRAALYICLFFLWTIIEDVKTNNHVFADKMVLYSVVGIILFLIGAVGAEFFKSLPISGITRTEEVSQKTEVKETAQS